MNIICTLFGILRPTYILNRLEKMANSNGNINWKFIKGDAGKLGKVKKRTFISTSNFCLSSPMWVILVVGFVAVALVIFKGGVSL